MAKSSLLTRREIPHNLTVHAPDPPASLSIKHQSPVGQHAQPSLAVPGMRTVKQVLAERANTQRSLIPLPSPALSDSTASNYDSSPLTPYSATFNFSQHHSQFKDSADDGANNSSSSIDEGASNDSLPSPCSFGDLVIDSSFDSSTSSVHVSQPEVQHIDPSIISALGLDDPTSESDDGPSLPRMTANVSSAHQHKATFSADSSDFSPNVSLADIQVARLVQRVVSPQTPTEDRSLRDGNTPTRGIGSVTPPRPVLLENEWISGGMPLLSPNSNEKPLSRAAKNLPILEQRPHSAVSVYSNPDEVPTNTDPTVTPEADALVRMRSILGPKTRIISPAPWDDADDELPLANLKDEQKIKSRKPVESRPVRHDPSRSLSPSKENASVKPKTASRTRSFSMLVSRKVTPTTEEAKESEEALRSLVMGLGIDALESPKNKSLAKVRASGLTIGPPIAIVELPTMTKSPSNASVRSGNRPLSPAQRMSSSEDSSLPRSAPPQLSSFLANAPDASSIDSKTILMVDVAAARVLNGASGHEADDSDVKTPTTFRVCPQSPTSPTALNSPMSLLSGTASPNIAVSKGYKLISLDEARRRQNERIATEALAQKRAVSPFAYEDSEIENLAVAASASDSTAELNAPRASVSTFQEDFSATPVLPQGKTLKMKKSGFLKRMMGGGEKAEAPKVPSLPSSAISGVAEPSTSGSSGEFSSRSSTRSAAPMSRLVRSSSENTVLAESQSLSGLAAVPSVLKSSLLSKSGPPSTSAAPPTRIAFSKPPVPHPEQRLRNGKNTGLGTAVSIPSLSLRPISMAFSAGLPSDFLAELEAADDDSDSVSLPASTQSPFAASFNSSVTNTSSLFETAPTSPTSTTPLTPNFTETFSLTVTEKPQFSWEQEKAELENTIKELRAALFDRRECTKCGHCFTEDDGLSPPNTPMTPMSPSVVDRPRFPGHAGGARARVLF